MADGPDFAKAATPGAGYDGSPSGLGTVPAWLNTIPKANIPGSAVNGITGWFKGDATILAGTGYSVARGSAGVYTVTFAAALSTAPLVTVSLLTGGGYTGVLAVLSGAPSSGGFVVHTLDSSFSAADANVQFLAVVPQ